MSSFNATANILINHLGTMADGKTEIRMFDQFSCAALDVICKVTCWKLFPKKLRNYRILSFAIFFAGKFLPFSWYINHKIITACPLKTTLR